MTFDAPVPVVLMGRQPLNIEDILDLAHGRAHAALDDHPEVPARIDAAAQLLANMVRDSRVVYGVTT
ncbi:MAG: histidine ammonia-lyase, partial [Deltaproteobacteria bacterium]|nr:histidine ammonia-lyase [Deltaproteobacteria bacterium]